MYSSDDWRWLIPIVAALIIGAGIGWLLFS